jgi:proteasome lid subunit RPN8/RPN11
VSYRLRIPSELSARLSGEAAERAPEECCGVLLGRRSGRVGVVAATRGAANLARDRRRRYVVDPAVLIASARSARELGLQVLGYYHSHPRGDAEPSAEDFSNAWPDMSYLILGRGPTADARCWRLAADGAAFEPEELEIFGS